MRQDDENMLEAGLAYHDAGLCVLPATRDADGKRPSVDKLTPYWSRLSTPDEIREWFTTESNRRGNALCLVCGAVSGNLEVIDFDMEGEMFPPWCEAVGSDAPGLLERLVIERSPSGGWHVFYRVDERVGGSRKLASRVILAEGPDEAAWAGKTYKPRKCQSTGRWIITPTLIETRAEGGLILCDPSPGYELTQGRLIDLPVITGEERDTLLSAARALDEVPLDIVGRPSRSAPTRPSSLRPGDDFNARGDIRPLIAEVGWALVRPGENEHWCRPGKTAGTSATLKDGVFYVFTSNAPPFEPSKGYSPFAVYALLRCDGNFREAAWQLAQEGYGEMHDNALPERPPSTQPMPGPVLPRAISVGTLLRKYTAARTPIVHGLLRRGETMNVIAAPKIGKSWLSMDLAAAVATGGKWLGAFSTEAGDVLILDNELHPETAADRFPRVAATRDIPLDAIAERVFIDNTRGRLLDVRCLDEYFGSAGVGRYRMVIIDALYRFLPPGLNENDNGAMAGVYNEIDAVADRFGCSFVLVHHTSKGEQAGKAVTDVGAGAGAQSRATDAHMVLRPHREQDVVVMEATARSWPPVSPMCLRWKFPVWVPEPGLDPTKLQQRGSRGMGPDPRDDMTVAQFVEQFGSERQAARSAIVEAAKEAGLSGRGAERLLKAAVREGLLYQHETRRAFEQRFSTVPPGGRSDPEGASS